MQPPKIVRQELLYEGYLNLKRITLEKPTKETLGYTYFSLPTDAVFTIGLNQEGKFLLVREYRYPLENYILSCSGGKLEMGEDPLSAAKRELFEETGYSADEFLLLGKCHPVPALSDQKVYFALAKNVRLTSTPTPDPFEIIRPEFMTEQAIYEEIKRGENVDGHLLTALSFLRMSCPQISKTTE